MIPLTGSNEKVGRTEERSDDVPALAVPTDSDCRSGASLDPAYAESGHVNFVDVGKS